jgi:hypothetical protein
MVKRSDDNQHDGGDDRDLERQIEREQDRRQREINSVWSECTYDDLPDWARRELDEEAERAGESGDDCKA